MSILSWLFGAPGWLLAGGLILVAVFGLVPSISKWLWVACIVAVGAWGAAGYGKAALQAHRTHEAGDKLLQAEQALRTAGAEPGMAGAEPAAERVQSYGEEHRHEQVEAVDQAQFGKAAEVRNGLPVRAEAARGQEPAHVCPQKAVLPRRMHVLGRVGMAVVVAMMGGPPQWSTLHAHGTDRSEHELERARGAEGAMREVAVVEAGQGEHAHGIKQGCDQQRGRRHANPDHADAGNVHGDERDRAPPVDAIGALAERRRLSRVEPVAQARCDARVAG